ncbi:hypothetical protein MUK42_20042 [Musa troglodytarum]|uniref:Uncharacterized protein n=1 Tax=Musa troglodytarum TaxID=320322 RepID=A0A9E7FX33_9LILI|nr:hypothetical protein MUK42_20042 [Musa troglodytarum]
MIRRGRTTRPRSFVYIHLIISLVRSKSIRTKEKRRLPQRPPIAFSASRLRRKRSQLPCVLLMLR